MTFKESKDTIKRNQHLIGLKYRGAIIDEFIIYPSDNVSLELFLENYLETFNATISSELFKDRNDLNVGVITNKEMIRISGVFFYTNIQNLKDEGINVC